MVVSSVFLAACLLCLVIPPVLSLLQNVTIDDEYGDFQTGVKPTYLEVGGCGWKQGSKCTDCFAQPDASQAFNGTWHDATYHEEDGNYCGINLEFTGQAAYVFFIIPNHVDGADTFVKLIFTLDGENVWTYSHEPGNTTEFAYNALVYSNDKIQPGHHSLMIVMAGPKPALSLFDRMIYTTDIPEISSGEQQPPTIQTSTVQTSTYPSDITPVDTPTLSMQTLTEQTSIHPSNITSVDTPIQSQTLRPPDARNLGLAIGLSIGGSLLTLAVVIALCCLRKRGHKKTEKTESVRPDDIPREMGTNLQQGNSHQSETAPLKSTLSTSDTPRRSPSQVADNRTPNTDLHNTDAQTNSSYIDEPPPSYR